MIEVNRNHIYNQIKYLELNEYVEGIMPDGQSFYINYEDYDVVKNNCWHYMDGYLRSTRLGLMHRYFLQNELTEKLQIDHIDNNRLNNCRNNLRIVTQQENLNKKTLYKSNKSGHQGVKWNTRLSKWQVQITRNKKRIHLGVFDNLQDAVIARRKAEATI